MLLSQSYDAHTHTKRHLPYYVDSLPRVSPSVSQLNAKHHNLNMVFIQTLREAMASAQLCAAHLHLRPVST